MTPEKRVENKIRKAFEDAGGYINKVFASPNTNKGIPDLIGSLNGIYVALEIKRLHGGKPTPVQINNLQAIANAGGLAFVTNDENLVKKLITKTKNYQIAKQKLNCRNVKIDFWSVNKQPSVKEATSHWQQTKEPHSLQLIKWSNQ